MSKIVYFVTLRETNAAEPNNLSFIYHLSPISYLLSTDFYSGDVIRLSILNNKELSIADNLLTSDS